MKIHSLQITNFKSYYGRQLIGPFSEHFTCIIGPNGNGKSNILDAMLFVFGFKSSKLRQDSLASLIHSSAYGQPDEAKVAVNFIESSALGQTKLPIDSSGQFVTVTRTIRKSGQCFYQLNQKRTQWHQLKQFLISKSIDLQKNLFIILQGQVQRLCQLSPQKLVQYLEYVSGSDQFLQQINQLQKKYINGGIQQQIIKQRFGVCKKVYSQQQKEAYELLEHMMMRVSLVEIGLLCVKKMFISAGQNLTVYKEKLTVEMEKIKIAQQRLTSIITQTTHLHQKHSTNTNTIIQTEKLISKQQSEITTIQLQQIKKIQAELQFSTRDIKQKEKQVELIEKEKYQLMKMLEDEKEIREKAKDVQEVLKKLLGEEDMQVKMEINEGGKSGKKAQKKQKKLQTKKKQKPKDNQNNQQSPSPPSSSTKPSLSNPLYKSLFQIYKLIQQIQKQKLSIHSVTSKQLQPKQQQHQTLSITYTNLTQRYGKSGELFKPSHEVTSLLKAKLRKYAQLEQQRNNEIQSITQSLQQLQRRLHQTDSTRTLITTQQKLINQLKLANRYNILLKGKQLLTLRQVLILPIQQSGLINAITPQLDYIIVQNHSQAQQVIDFLNSKKLGRMSFLLMEEIQKLAKDIKVEWNHEQKKLPNGCCRIYDTIKPIDKKYQKLTFWCVGNTLIADTLDDAMKAAYNSAQAFRVITKQGVFIDLAGTMTKVPLITRAHEDRTLLETRQKVLQNKYDDEMRRIAQMRRQKQLTVEQLNKHLVQDSNKEFSTIDELITHMRSLQQQMKTLDDGMAKIKGNKSAMQLQIRLGQKEVQELKRKVRAQMKLLQHVTLEQVMQVVQEYEKVLGKIKKLQISSQLINSHQTKLQKTKEEMYKLYEVIRFKKELIENFQKQVKQKRLKIHQIQGKKKLLESQNSQIQQQIFVKELDIKFLKGQIHKDDKDYGSNQKQNGDKERKKIAKTSRDSTGSEMPDMEMYSGQRNKKKNQQNQKLPQQQEQLTNHITSSSSMASIRKEQKRLNQLIIATQKQFKKLQKCYDQQINSLRNIYQFLVRKCKKGQEEKKKEMEKLAEEKLMKRREENEEFTDTNMQSDCPRISILSLQDILIEFIQTNNLTKPSSQSQRDQQHLHPNTNNNPSINLKEILHNQQQITTHPKCISETIFSCLFNHVKIMNIGVKDEYYFQHFISSKEKLMIVSENGNKNENLNGNENESSLITLSNTTSLTEDLINHITLQKLKFLQQYHSDKLTQFQRNSSSLYLKSGKKSKHHNKKLPSSQQHQDQNQQNLIQLNTSQHFDDPQFPLAQCQLQILQQFITKKNQFLTTQHQLSIIQNQQKSLYTSLLHIRQLRTQCYLSTFNLINIQVNKIYNFLTKGNAEINLTNSINPFQGLQFSVRPFNKSWKSVNLLSGGQKTLTSLALIFACEQVKKFPFYFMDEIDAALDYKNVTNLGKYVKQKQNVQHIVISLRKNMYEQCDRLVCIYKIKDVTRTMIVGMEELYGLKRASEGRTLKRDEEKYNGETIQEDLDEGGNSTQTLSLN